jgi:hypothetical protein
MAAEPNLPILGLGHEYDLSGAREEFLLPDPIVDDSVAPDHPLYVRIRVPWALVETTRGVYEWSEVERIVGPYLEARYVVSLCLYGSNPAVDAGGALPGPDRPEVLKAWLEFARAAGRQFKGRVRFYEIWDGPNREARWAGERVADFAYLTKNTSVTIRSADSAAFVAQGSLHLDAETLDADLAWQAALYREEIATYVDVLPARPGPDLGLPRALSRLYDLILENDPSAQMWAVGVPLSGEDDRARAADLLARFIAGQGEGAALVSFDLEADVEGQPDLRNVLLDLHKLFLPTFQRVPGGRVAFEPFEAGGARPTGIAAYEFFDAKAFQGLVGFHSPAPPPDGKARMVLPTAAVRGVAVYDIVGGAAGPIRSIEPDFKANTTRVPVFVFDRLQVLQYARVPIKGFEVEKEELEIKETGLITAEEVIAGHQTFMADQNFRLKHYQGEGLLTYHGKIAGSNSVDISFDVAFSWDRETGAEWEQRALYYNGVLWRSERLPPLPIPSVEQVFTLPLDINLNKDYRYTYAGREKVGEYDCHVLEFEPIDPARNLYKGRAWIETRTFALVRTSTVQDKLSPPLISNEERNTFAPVAGPDGATYWILSRLEGQQILTLAGENLVLLREIDFKNLKINDPGFAESRQRGYASERNILRDTKEGLKYLARTETGERVLAEPPQAVWLGLAGLYRQTGLDYPVVPLAGAGYFNFDVKEKDLQTTALLGGAVNLVSLAKPNLFGKRLDANAQLVAVAFSLTDQLYLRGEEREESHVDARTQDLSFSLGVPLGNFWRARATYGLEYVDYGRDDDTDSFVVPTDTLIQTPGVWVEFNRDAWTASASAEHGIRNDWKPWGDTTVPASPEIAAQFPSSPCDSPGSCLSEFDPEQKDFDRYEFSISRQVFLKRFQKLRFQGVWQTGSRLDRFSQFHFSFFGNRVRGFSGSGVRYDRGGIARAQYAFNIGSVIRFDASLDVAYVRDGLLEDDYRTFTGFGVSGNLMGPWDTVLQFDIGVALQSDFDDLRGNTEFQIGLLKYFGERLRPKK